MSANGASQLHPPRAVLFDMDGTLTVPLLDFPQIKRDMGIGPGPILESLMELDEHRRARALEVLHAHERRAAEESTLMPGCRELLDELHARRIAIALITRNSRQSVRTVFDRHAIHFDVVITRDDAPPKPSPEPIFVALSRLALQELPAQEAWMVGDGYHDIESAVAAGVSAVWVSHGQDRDFDARPTHQVQDLLELHQLIAELCDSTR